jgi:S-ribosylhomocysteine lyase LuxS involved in autoinducer biosynthesis
VVKTNVVIVSPLGEKTSFNLIVKRENKYKQTKMTEIKLYIYKVIEMDKMMGY